MVLECCLLSPDMPHAFCNSSLRGEFVVWPRRSRLKLPDARADGPDLHQAVCGTATWRRLSVAFYSRVDRDPLLRPLFPGKTHCAIKELTAFPAQLFGRPSDDTQRRWWARCADEGLVFVALELALAVWSVRNALGARKAIKADFFWSSDAVLGERC
jgi:hypothetical protein